MKKYSAILSLLFMFTVAVFLSAVPRAAVALVSVPPVIRFSPENFYPVTELLYVEGAAVPRAAVALLISGPNTSPLNFEINADAAGNWIFSKTVLLSPGVYEMRVRQSAGNMLSGWSAPKTLRALSAGVHLFGINFLYSTLAFFAAFMIAVMIVAHVYFWLKLRKIKRWSNPPHP